MATAKAERLLNLVIALVNAPRFRSADWIRQKVAGYGDAPSDEAFSRMFERDKQELRELGIPIQTSAAPEEGYRILPGEFALPPMSFSPAEAAALALAGRLWDATVLADAGSGAFRKIRDAAEMGSGGTGGGTDGGGAEGGGEPPTAGPASSMLQARVRTSDPAFAPLYAAVKDRRAVRFDYRKDPAGPPQARSVHPWGLVSYRGWWYVVGHDSDRQATRTFRLSRITGPVVAVGRPGAVDVPADVDLLSRVARSGDDASAQTATALLRIRPGRAAGLRRHGRTVVAAAAASEPATSERAASGPGALERGTSERGTSERGTSERGTGGPGGNGMDQVEVPLGSLWDTARRIAAQGPDVVVVDPPDLRDAVVRLLTGTLNAAEAGG